MCRSHDTLNMSTQVSHSIQRLRASTIHHGGLFLFILTGFVDRHIRYWGVHFLQVSLIKHSYKFNQNRSIYRFFLVAFLGI